MASSTTPYRQAFGYCALCGAQVRADELEALVLLEACPRCRRGEVDEALRNHEMTLKHHRHVGPGFSGSSPAVHYLGFDLERPTELDAFAIFSPEPEAKGLLARLFRSEDPEIGEPAFDRAVHLDIQPGFGPQVVVMLERDGIREGILRLVALGARIELGFRLVSATFESTDESTLPDVADVRALLVPLAIHLEAYAKMIV